MGASNIEGYNVGLRLLYGHVHDAWVAHDDGALQGLLVVDLAQAGLALLDRLQVLFHLLRLGHALRLRALGRRLRLLAPRALLRLLRHLTRFPARRVLRGSLASLFGDRRELELLFFRRFGRLLNLSRRHFVQIVHLHLLDLLLHFLGVEGRLLVLQLLLRVAELGREEISVFPHFGVNHLDFLQLLLEVLPQYFQVVFECFFQRSNRFLKRRLQFTYYSSRF